MTSKSKDSKGEPQSSGWRQGRWSLEEEQYVELLIREFKIGTLPLAEGTTLRYFLSKMVNCNPKRVSKKYENTNYNGKHKYEPTSVPMSLDETNKRRERLQEFERRFLGASKRAEEEQNFDEHHLQKSLEESRAQNMKGRASQAHVHAMSSLDGFQDRLSAELQTRMELANRYAGGGCAGASLRDMSLGMPQGLPSPRTQGKPQFGGGLQNAGAFDYVSSVRQNPSYASAMGLQGQLASPELEDPLAWQVRSQSQAAAAQIFMTEGRRITGQLISKETAHLLQSKRDGSLSGAGGGGLPFPTLAGKDNRLHLHAAASMGHMSQLELASLEQRSRAVSKLRQDALANDLASRHNLLRPQQRSAGLMARNLEMIDNLKRGHDEMQSFRPSKRFR